jgi:hypothetical protein
MESRLVALTRFVGNVAFSAPAKARGCSVVRADVGEYTVTLSEAVAENDVEVSIVNASNTAARFLAARPDGSTISIFVTTEALAATDTFTVIVAVRKVDGG